MDVLAVITLIVSVIGALAALLVVPEMRRFFGLDKTSNSTKTIYTYLNYIRRQADQVISRISQRTGVSTKNIALAFLSFFIIVIVFTIPNIFRPLPGGADSAFRMYLFQSCLQANVECEEPSITKVVHLPVNEAANRNGIQDQWCIEFSQMRRGTIMQGDNWTETRDLMIATKADNMWSVQGGLLSCDAMAR